MCVDLEFPPGGDPELDPGLDDNSKMNGQYVSERVPPPPAENEESDEEEPDEESNHDKSDAVELYRVFAEGAHMVHFDIDPQNG